MPENPDIGHAKDMQSRRCENPTRHDREGTQLPSLSTHRVKYSPREGRHRIGLDQRLVRDVPRHLCTNCDGYDADDSCYEIPPIFGMLVSSMIKMFVGPLSRVCWPKNFKPRMINTYGGPLKLA